MGLFDLPAPVFSAVDSWLTPFLPAAVRLILWAALGAILSMELYRLLSPQERIATTKEKFETARRRVAEFDGEFSEAWPHMRKMLALAFRRIALVFPATIAASLPLLAVIVWLSNQYGTTYPPSHEPVAISVPGEFEGRWVGTDPATPHAEIVDGNGSPVAEVAVTRPIPVIHKRAWWNTLIGNPAGYLDDNLPFDRIEIALPRQEILHLGPGWLRGWEVLFFAAMVLFALVFKSLRRIA